MTTVFCTNGMLSKTLAVVRSLGKQGVRVIVGEKIRYHTSGFSKFCDKALFYPDPQKQPAAYYEWLRTTLIREKVDVLFPMDEDTMEIAVRHQEELRQICKLPVPSLESYLVASDKANTMRLAMKTGVPCPQTEEFHFAGEADLQELATRAKGMQFPLVIKPRHSSGSRGVRFVQDMKELLDTYAEIHRDYPNPMLQECIPYGPKLDVCLSFDSNHRLTGAFVQNEIRNYPIESGPSTVVESVEHAELLAHSLKLMENLPWYGVVDVEFMIDPRSGEPKLMEINPRFWSSVHLSIRSGVDFPNLLLRHALGEDVEPALTYRTGVQGRALLPGDTLHFLSNPKRFQMKPSFFTTKLPDDIVSMSDPMPTVGFLLSALRYSLDVNIWKFIIRR